MILPLCGKYLVRNRLLNLFLKSFDLFFPKSRKSQLGFPRRILLANWAHLGDVVIATSVLPALKKAFPETEIGFLVSSLAVPILENHPLIHHLHVIDHWKLNRAPLALGQKFVRYRKMKQRVIKEIQALKYDVGIDFRFHFPNAIPILWKAGIPVRIGYTSGGFGRLLTHPFDWCDKKQPIASYHFDLLREFGVEKDSLLPQLVSTDSVIFPFQLPAKGFLIFHVGPPSSRGWKKSWESIKWRELTNRITESGRAIIFTGSGEKERRSIEDICQGLVPTINACGLLSWHAWVALIEKSEGVVTVDTAAGHVASTFQKPTIVLFCGINEIRQWKPPHPRCIALMHPMPCAPCHNKEGCPNMACVREISVDDVWNALTILQII